MERDGAPSGLLATPPDTHCAQNWTGVVKGRILVHALREHYSQDDLVPASPTATEIVMSDKWTLEYLNIAWLHPILEAIDDDTSGYISVSEVNRFMQRLPPELNWRCVPQLRTMTTRGTH